MISINEDLIETSNSGVGGGISMNANASANVDLNRKLNLLKQLKITFESIMFNYGLNSPNIWQQITTLMNIFAKNIHSILEDEIIDELNLDESSSINSNRTHSFSMPYELENINYKQRLIKNQRLWSFISTALQPDSNNNNNNKFKMIQKQLNGQLNSDVIELINEWILISLKSCTLLEQLKQLFNENNQKFMSIYYKQNSFLFDKQLLNDFFLYINAYETRDYSLLDQQNVNVNGYFGDFDANKSNQQQYLDVKTHKTHRRMHSCPIVDKQSGSAQTTITGSSIEDNLMTINVKMNDNEQSEAVSNESGGVAVTVNDEDSDENESINDEKSNELNNLNDLIYSKTSIVDYIHSQQLYYDRSLLDKENSHFYIAELTLSTIELMKNEDKLSANPVGMEDNYIRKFHMRSTLPRQIPSMSTSWLKATSSSTTSSTYDLSMSPLSISQSHSASQPVYLDQLSPKQMSIDGGDLDFRTESTSSTDTTTTVSTQQETVSSSRETPASFLTTTTSGIGDSLSILIDRSRSPSPSSVTRRYSWEYSNNERTINAESLSKLIIKSYLNKKQSNKNRPAPTLVDYKHLIESSNYAEFTKFFVKQAQGSTTNDFANNSTNSQLTSSQKLEFNNQEARIIGDDYWAPVREQLILNANKVKLKRILQMKQQYFRCADCGYKINDENKIKTFRYCEYFCKYFCRCCHSKQQSYIPSYIIYSSDYRQTYYVCKKAKYFLDKIYHEPLITLEDLNPKLFDSQSSSIFYRIKQLRTKLYNCKRYIHSCRLAIGLKQQLEDNFVDFLYNDTRVYSISTLYAFKKENLYDRLKTIAQNIIDHIRKCEICSQQGYICELCNKSQELLYPFDIDSVSKCPNCLACYHRNCFNVNKPENCPRCRRKKLRNKSVSDQQQQQQLEKSNSIDSSIN